MVIWWRCSELSWRLVVVDTAICSTHHTQPHTYATLCCLLWQNKTRTWGADSDTRRGARPGPVSSCGHHRLTLASCTPCEMP